MQKSKPALVTSIFIGLLMTILPLTGQTKAVCDETSWSNVIPPTQEAMLLNWLNKKEYRKNFLPEPAAHPSKVGVHGDVVRTYYNPVLVNDLARDKRIFNKGAAMVKELYNGDEVTGYSVMIKTVKRKGGSRSKDWTFYETFNTAGTGAFYGKGISVCTGCHIRGMDFLLSTFRP